MSLVQCYNKGCGLKYNPEDNNEGSCEYHPGAPIFHDAYKGWSCCNKKTTDFTTFLNTKGCTKGRHNPTKPEEPKRPKPDPNTRDEVVTVTAPSHAPSIPQALPRPDYNTPMTPLPVTVTPSLKQALEKAAAAQAEEAVENGSNSNVQDGEVTSKGIKIGETCKNNGCKTTYEGEHSNLELCHHHPGYPVFHEGLKYWTCCVKKTTDFTDFLAQTGCSTSHHCWTKPDGKKVATCRYDWHQTGTQVCVAIYAKLCDPSATVVQANPIRLSASIVFGDGNVFKLDMELAGIIDVAQSSVSLAGTKVEIKMRKAEPGSWRSLVVVEKSTGNTASEGEEEEKLEDMKQRVEAVDLSDL